MQSKQCPAELGAFSLGFHFINMLRMCQRGGVHFGSKEGVSRIALHCFFLLSLARQYLLHGMQVFLR